MRSAGTHVSDEFKCTRRDCLASLGQRNLVEADHEIIQIEQGSGVQSVSGKKTAAINMQDSGSRVSDVTSTSSKVCGAVSDGAQVDLHAFFLCIGNSWCNRHC